MKGCSLAKKRKMGGSRKKACWTKGGCGSCGSLSGGRSRRNRRMLAYSPEHPGAQSVSQTDFQKGHLAFTPNKTGGQNPNLPYGQIPPTNNEFPPGVSKPQNLKGGGEINQSLIYGPTNTGGKRRRGGAWKKKRGGSWGSDGKWPDGLTGSAWGASAAELPGANGIAGDRNYLLLNNYKFDPQTEGVINGRALTGGKSRSRKSRGGGFIPQDLVNVGRQAMFGLGSAYNALAGYQAPVNPMPYQDQLPGTPTLNSLNYYRL